MSRVSESQVHYASSVTFSDKKSGMARKILESGREQTLFNSAVLHRAYTKTKTDPAQIADARQLDASRLLDASFRYEAQSLKYGPEPPGLQGGDRWQGDGCGSVSSVIEGLRAAQLTQATTQHAALEYDSLSSNALASGPLSAPLNAGVPASGSGMPPSRPEPSPRGLLADIDMALLTTPSKSTTDTARRLDALHARLRVVQPQGADSRPHETPPLVGHSSNDSHNDSHNYVLSPAGDVSLFHYSPVRPPMRFSAVWHGPELARLEGQESDGVAAAAAAATSQVPDAPSIFSGASPAKSDVSFTYALSAFADG